MPVPSSTFFRAIIDVAIPLSFMYLFPSCSYWLMHTKSTPVKDTVRLEGALMSRAPLVGFPQPPPHEAGPYNKVLPVNLCDHRRHQRNDKPHHCQPRKHASLPQHLPFLVAYHRWTPWRCGTGADALIMFSLLRMIMENSSMPRDGKTQKIKTIQINSFIFLSPLGPSFLSLGEARSSQALIPC